jgi:hypothetical protein
MLPISRLAMIIAACEQKGDAVSMTIVESPPE